MGPKFPRRNCEAARALALIEQIAFSLGIDAERGDEFNAAGPANVMEIVLAWAVDQGHDEDAVLHALAYAIRTRRGSWEPSAVIEGLTEVPG